MFPPEQRRRTKSSKAWPDRRLEVRADSILRAHKSRPTGEAKSVMRITIDERLRQVHVSQGPMLLTLQLGRADALPELEAAAEALRAALEKARVVVINGDPIRL